MGRQEESISDDPPESGEAGAREVARAIMAPLQVLQIDAGELSSWQLAHYSVAASQAIALLHLDDAVSKARRGM